MDPYATGLFPVCVATHDHGVRQLFDLSTLLLLLDCKPGDRVLDLGAGPGFSSEMLARLGYDVVAIDPDFTALCNNRRRPTFDPTRIQGTVRVVQGTAEALPFAAASFDGVLGMSVMHHVPDLSSSIAEIGRILRPGRRAVFCEPGLDHLGDLNTKRAIREKGENDQAFDVVAFLNEAIARGFGYAALTATVFPQLRLVPVQEIELYLTGKHPHPWLRPEGVYEELHRRHTYALIKQQGEREKTSRHPGLLRCDLQTEGVLDRARAGAVFPVTIQATNTGDTVWLHKPTPFGGYVTAGYKLAAEDGRVLDTPPNRGFLSRDVRPAESVTTSIDVALPEGLAPGRYQLQFDMVAELVNWFSDLTGTPQAPQDILIV